ncbi:copper radical oxidase [Echria macrotheca]|uniref:Copper radical oxidase n=1 Tax=Echria macrotheca TaxID=438768 RepID=A0AAJ0BMW4_9PEZI|nr:copper radical oxidase [Echria macrotheca]
MSKPELEGKWGNPFNLKNVAVHASLLHTGKVLYWGRRADPRADPDISNGNLDEHDTSAYLWDPAQPTPESKADPQPQPPDVALKGTNLFCSGHAFLPDGTLLIAGGHDGGDGKGAKAITTYHPDDNQFHLRLTTKLGRWYPSVLTLPDGRALIVSGSNSDFDVLEVTDPLWQLSLGKDGKIKTVIPLYPRLHLTPEGNVIATGPQDQSWILTIKDTSDKGGKDLLMNVPDAHRKDAAAATVVGKWSDPNTRRPNSYRDYCPSVMYAPGKIMYIGGGSDGGDTKDEVVKNPQRDAQPTKEVEFLDLNKPLPATWTIEAKTNMKRPRRMHNATILPDGSVLVTGGTSGATFNNLKTPEKTPELFSPITRTWTDMAPEDDGRMYHSIALLLPSGQVLSAGGGEYQTRGAVSPDGDPPKVMAANCLRTARIYDPPYLWKAGGVKAARPVILSTPEPRELKYGQEFEIKIGYNDGSNTIPKLPTVATPPPTNDGKADSVIRGVSWMRLGSVTHTRNMSQSIVFLKFTQNQATVKITAPATNIIAPPGYYLLFVLDDKGVPSEGRIMRISQEGKPVSSTTATSNKPKARLAAAEAPRTVQLTLSEHSERIVAEQDRPPVVVGITPLCPYGLGPCWAGAFDALRRIRDVEMVAPTPSQEDSVAFVYTKERDLLPDIDVWRRELRETINASYQMRAIEVTVEGTVGGVKESNKLKLVLSGGRELGLGEFTQKSQVRWDVTTGADKPVTADEAAAYGRLVQALKGSSAGDGAKVKVTGTLQKLGAGGFSLDVRAFEVL